MTAQDHIDAIGRALMKSEEAVKATRKALKLVEEHHAILHARLDTDLNPNVRSSSEPK
jgi:hypothetical protein